LFADTQGVFFSAAAELSAPFCSDDLVRSVSRKTTGGFSDIGWSGYTNSSM
jgi:hypothetical protein